MGILPTSLQRPARALLAVSLLSALLPATQVLRPLVPAAAATGGGSISLHVESARSVNNGPGFVHKGDPVAIISFLTKILIKTRCHADSRILIAGM